MTENLPEAEVRESKNINSGVDLSRLFTLSEAAFHAVSLVLYLYRVLFIVIHVYMM